MQPGTPPEDIQKDRNVIISHKTAEDTYNIENLPDPNKTEIEELKIAAVKKKLFSLPEKTSRARQRRPETWKRKRSATLRESGQPYISQNRKPKLGKVPELESLCKKNYCRLKCNDQFDESDRKEIFRKYYALDINAKNALLFKAISVKPVKRHRKNISKPKVSSFKYTLTNKQRVITVCKTAFCSLYQISNKEVQIIQQKLNSGTSAPSPDKRGRHETRPHKISTQVIDAIKAHIQSFPAEQSHYSRNRNVNKKYLSPLLNISRMHKLYLEHCKDNKLPKTYLVSKSFYCNIFSHHFNLSFGQPRSDTCSTCDAGLKSAEHTENYKYAFEQQKRDREFSRANTEVCYLTMDLQQTMPLPRLTTSKAFYLRQMWFYNFGVHTITSSGDKSYFLTWTEDIATKGSLEIGSCLHTFIQILNGENKNIQHLIIWSDSCSGQNKNFNIICLYQYLIYKGYVKIIDHKFPEVGHSFLDSDRDFGRIEKKLKKIETLYTPDQYRDVIKSSSNKKSVVVNMEHHFKLIPEIATKLYLINKKKNTLEEKISLRDNVKWIRVEEYGSYYYKDTLDENTPFLKVDIMKSRHRKLEKEDFKLELIRNKNNALSAEKNSNLKEQLQYIDDEYKYFYQKVIGCETENQNSKLNKKRRTV